MEETWANTEMGAKAEIVGCVGLSTGAQTRAEDVMGEVREMGTGVRAGAGPGA